MQGCSDNRSKKTFSRFEQEPTHREFRTSLTRSTSCEITLDLTKLHRQRNTLSVGDIHRPMAVCCLAPTAISTPTVCEPKDVII
jgi:hypothetical protein